jgi:hypothetical protein
MEMDKIVIVSLALISILLLIAYRTEMTHKNFGVSLVRNRLKGLGVHLTYADHWAGRRLEVAYFPAYKTHFFSEKCDLNSNCVLYAEGISKLINIRTSIVQHLYREIGKFASKSWDLASLLVNGLLSHPGIRPNFHIATHVTPVIYAATVAKCSRV